MKQTRYGIYPIDMIVVAIFSSTVTFDKQANKSISQNFFFKGPCFEKQNMELDYLNPPKNGK